MRRRIGSLFYPAAVLMMLAVCLPSPVSGQPRQTLPAEPATPPTAASPPEASPQGNIVPMRLAKGLRLLVLEEPDAETIAVEVFFQVGIAEEQRYPGINALIARTWGSESEDRYGPLLRADIARVGGIGTDFADDWVELWGMSAASPGDFHKLLQSVLTNLVARPLFSESALLRTREEQRQELLLREDDLLSDLLQRLRGRVYGNSPYGLSSLGSEGTLSQLTAGVLTSYYRARFRPERCVIVVAGKVTREDARRLVEDSLGAGGWFEGASAPPLPEIPGEAIPPGLRDLRVPRTAPGGIVALSYLAPGTASGSKEDYVKLLLLNAVVGGGKASRLFATLRDGQGIETPPAYDLRSEVFAKRQQSLWVVYAIGVLDIAACRTRLREELAALASGKRPITRDELERARLYLKTRYLREHQRLKERAFGAGWAETMGLGAEFDLRFTAYLEAISLEDLNAFAGRILSAPSAAAFLGGGGVAQFREP